jgi:hypothetical protein
MQVFLLLDQDVRPLKLYPLSGKGNKPVEIVPVGDVPSDVEKSFYGAALAAYNFITKNGGKVTHSIFAYELESDIARRIYGGSGALAFAVAVMSEMLGVAGRQVIGATGVIDTEKGMVRGVGAIQDKIASILRNNPGITVIFYPQENASEITPELKLALRQSRIKLHPVRSLHDIYQALVGRKIENGNVVRTPEKKTAWMVSGVILLFIYVVYTFSSHLTASYLLENEHYAFARWHLLTAGRLAFFNSELTKIAEDFQTPLETQGIFSLRFSMGREETYPIDRVPPEFLLSDRDVFAFRIEPYETLYVYILQSEGSGSFRKLYPSGRQADAVFSSLQIPGIGIFFRPEGKAGNKDIYLVFSRWRCLVLEKALFVSGQNFSFPADMNHYNLEEQSIQLKKVSMSLDK